MGRWLMLGMAALLIAGCGGGAPRDKTGLVDAWGVPSDVMWFEETLSLAVRPAPRSKPDRPLLEVRLINRRQWVPHLGRGAIAEPAGRDSKEEVLILGRGDSAAIKMPMADGEFTGRAEMLDASGIYFSGEYWRPGDDGDQVLEWRAKATPPAGDEIKLFSVSSDGIRDFIHP